MTTLATSPANLTPTLAFASGKGGVGKTAVLLTFATLLARQKLKVLLFDGDFGLANLDVQLNLNTAADLSHVLNGHRSMEEIITPTPYGFDVIPGRSGAGGLPFMNAAERAGLLQSLRKTAAAYDVLLLDVAAGLDEATLTLTTFADKTILITTPDPSAVTDAYAMVKLMKLRHHCENAHLLVNQATSVLEGKQTTRKLVEACEKFLGVRLPVLGQLPYDREFAMAIKLQQLPAIAFPGSKSVMAIEDILRHHQRALIGQDKATPSFSHRVQGNG